MKIKFIFIIFVFCSSLHTSAQKNIKLEIDSILKLAKDSSSTHIGFSRYQAELALELSEKYELKEQKILSYISLSDCFYNRNNLPKSLEYLNLAEKITGSNDARLLCYIYNNKGYILCLIDKCEEGLFLLNKSIALAQSKSKSLLLRQAYINKGLIFQHMGNQDSALIYFYKSIPEVYADTIKEIAVSFNNIGNYFEETNKIDSAAWYYQKAHVLNKNDNDLVLETIILYGLSSVNKTQKNYSKAIEYADSSFQLSMKILFSPGIQDALKLKAEIYQEMDKKDEAIKVLNELITYNNSIIEENNTNTEQFDSLDKFQNKETTSSIVLNQTIIYFILAIIILLLILLIIKEKNKLKS